MIGLEIDLKKIVRAGRAIMVTAAVQIVGGCALGVDFSAARDADRGPRWDALLFRGRRTLNNTVIIVKLLYDKRRARHPPGATRHPGAAGRLSSMRRSPAICSR